VAVAAAGAARNAAVVAASVTVIAARNAAVVATTNDACIAAVALAPRVEIRQHGAHAQISCTGGGGTSGRSLEKAAAGR